MNQLPHPLTDDVIELYARVAEAPSADRQRLLSELPAGPVRETVAGLLEAGESLEAESLEQAFLEMERLITPAQGLELPADAPPHLGPRYVIERRLGHGGHGDVYLARQQWPAQRLVAVKVLRPGDMDPASVERICREARALAALDHPGVATVFDAGQASDGRPYLVTEFVDGPPIDTYCTRQNASFHQRCRLFASLCDAVEHTHQRGVIHRDLKPTNVLVAGGEQPQVKIVDLGIARILNPTDGAGQTLTQAGALLGTVGYMAPEQLRGEPADTRSDLFALGRMLQAVLADVPTPPRCRKDCAAIVRRATAAAPRDRYQSAGAFASDLRAMIDDAPVAARRHSLPETAARLVRRYPVPAALVLALAATLAVGGGFLAKQNAVASRARAAHTELSKEMLERSIVSLSRYVGTLGDRADLAASLEAQLSSQLALSPGDPEAIALRARVWTEQARIALANDDPEAAEPLARRAADVMLDLIHPATAEVEQVRQLAYAIIIWGDMLADLDRLDEAHDRYREAMRLHELGRARFPGHVGMLDDLTWSYDRAIDRGADLPARIERARIRLALGVKLLDMDPQRTISQYGLGVAHLRLGQLLYLNHDPKAIEELEIARLLLRPLLVAEGSFYWAFIDSLARACTVSGQYYSRAGDFEQARLAHAEAVSVQLRAAIIGPGAKGDAAQPLCQSLSRLARACEEVGRSEHAEAALLLRHLIETYPDDWSRRIDWFLPRDFDGLGPPDAPLTPRSAPAP